MMLSWRLRAVAFGAVVATSKIFAATTDDVATRVIVLANANEPDSVRIAQHYAVLRQVPAGNIITLKLPAAETITWREFVTQLWQPLLDQLVREHWIDAVPMALTDPVGRQKFAPNGHRIAALVVCRGVPLKIAHDPALATESPITNRPEFRTNSGAVDAELSLLAVPNYNINAFIPNPLFLLATPPAEAERQVVRVSRLDGPTAADALALVDAANVTERIGLAGRAYIDLSDRDAIGNEWLLSATRDLTELGFDVAIDREPATVAAAARFDAPAIYLGWYTSAMTGPFLLPGFRFPPGAIALHIHSYSAHTLRSATDGWVGPFVARGVTASMGNVSEPYLQLTHRPDLLTRSLARGMNLAAAAYSALNVLSWQAILIGDPLYRPFKVTLDEQLGRAASAEATRSPYAVVRRMLQWEASGRRAEALEFGQRMQETSPSLALGLALATRHEDAGNRARAAAVFADPDLSGRRAPDEWALVAEVARLLARVEAHSSSVAAWQAVLEDDRVPAALKSGWLPEAIATAKSAKMTVVAAKWERQRTERPPALID